MIFAFHLIDKPGALEQRVALRPLHKEYLSQVGQDVAFAGPLTRDAAHAWIKEEPFTKAGVYASVSIYPFENLWPQKKGFPK